jgi:hypothetical protein
MSDARIITPALRRWRDMTKMSSTAIKTAEALGLQHKNRGWKVKPKHHGFTIPKPRRSGGVIVGKADLSMGVQLDMFGGDDAI